MTRPYALTSTEGKLVLDAWEVFAMPSSMKDKELGWEFIKYCLSTREEPTCGSELYTYGIPVNKEIIGKRRNTSLPAAPIPTIAWDTPKATRAWTRTPQ